MYKKDKIYLQPQSILNKSGLKQNNNSSLITRVTYFCFILIP